ncbi:hypothetical protein PV325_010685 [Microctonus aethiopoides]|nr:hypothetical protein PV325_010685 [Microctonus aethiopoides]
MKDFNTKSSAEVDCATPRLLIRMSRSIGMLQRSDGTGRTPSFLGINMALNSKRWAGIFPQIIIKLKTLTSISTGMEELGRATGRDVSYQRCSIALHVLPKVATPPPTNEPLLPASSYVYHTSSPCVPSDEIGLESTGKFSSSVRPAEPKGPPVIRALGHPSEAVLLKYAPAVYGSKGLVTSCITAHA